MRVKVSGVGEASVSMKLRNSSEDIAMDRMSSGTTTTAGTSFSPINFATLDLWAPSSLKQILSAQKIMGRFSLVGMSNFKPSVVAER